MGGEWSAARPKQYGTTMQNTIQHFPFLFLGMEVPLVGVIHFTSHKLATPAYTVPLGLVVRGLVSHQIG
jgi:hypothetical protein